MLQTYVLPDFHTEVHRSCWGSQSKKRCMLLCSKYFSGQVVPFDVCSEKQSKPLRRKYESSQGETADT